MESDIVELFHAPDVSWTDFIPEHIKRIAIKAIEIHNRYPGTNYT